MIHNKAKSLIYKFLSYQPIISKNNIDYKKYTPEMSEEYFTSMRYLVKPYVTKELTTRNFSTRANNRVKTIVRLLPDDFNPEVILDVGCLNGIITTSLAEYYTDAQVFGLDVTKDHDLKEDKFEFILLKENEKYQFKDESVDLIVCMSVLHHVKDIDFIMKEFHRILKPGGYIVIREHDYNGKIIKDVLDVIHGLYASVLPVVQEETPKEFMKNHYAFYRSRVHWTNKIFKPNGFQLVSSNGSPNNPKNLQRMFFASYCKE